MLGYDDASFDGDWNIESQAQCWFSPIELYDANNTCSGVVDSGYDFMYTANLIKIKRFEKRSCFKDDDLWML